MLKIYSGRHCVFCGQPVTDAAQRTRQLISGALLTCGAESCLAQASSKVRQLVVFPLEHAGSRLKGMCSQEGLRPMNAADNAY